MFVPAVATNEFVRDTILRKVQLSPRFTVCDHTAILGYQWTIPPNKIFLNNGESFMLQVHIVNTYGYCDQGLYEHTINTQWMSKYKHWDLPKPCFASHHPPAVGHWGNAHTHKTLPKCRVSLTMSCFLTSPNFNSWSTMSYSNPCLQAWPASLSLFLDDQNHLELSRTI